jgi:outer membrane beta-barrel protein
VHRWILLSCCLAAVASAEEPLDLPGTVVVIQDRDFQLKHELSVGAGVLPLDAFYKGLTLQLGYTHHFNDSFAWQVGRATYSRNLETSLRSQLERQWGVEPGEFRQVQWIAGSDLMWTPVYGKTAGMNQAIAYFEGFLLGGGSVVKLNTGFAPAVNLGVGARLFLGQALSVRLDVTDQLVFSRGVMHVPGLQLAAAFNFGGAGVRAP